MRFALPVLLLAASVTLAAEYPTAKTPWSGAALEQKRAAFQKEIETLMNLPAEKVTAHPAAADFPGATPAGAKTVSRKITINTAVKGWHSTGLYAPPGAKITVTAPASWASAKYEVRIGCHTDKLWRPQIDRWTRVPQISRAVPITGKTTTAANAFGGSVYIVVPFNARPERVDVQIDGAIAAPHFVLGKTTPAQWREVRSAPGPWAELECGSIILSVPSADIRKLDDPTPVMQLWDRIARGQDALAAVDDRDKPERIAFDRQISAGYMHSGYPIMAPLSTVDEATAMEKLGKGNWGFFHELGHNHQKPEWTPPGTGEVTCNIFSMYCMEKFANQPRTNHPAMAADKRRERMQKYFGSTRDFEEWKKDPFLALILYWQLAEGFGWEPFTKVFAEYRRMPAGEKPKTETEKHEQFMVRFSRAVNRNLGPLYQAWNIPVSAEAVASIAKLPAWMPEPDFPKAYTRK